MFQINCLNPISKVGLDRLTADYKVTDNMNDAEGVLVRSASMHEMDLPENLLAVARAGAGVNNIPLDKCAQKGIVVFNTPGANANGVKELVIAGMLLAARDVVGGIEWVKASRDNADIAKKCRKNMGRKKRRTNRKEIRRYRSNGQKVRCHRSGCYRRQGGQYSSKPWYGSLWL